MDQNVQFKKLPPVWLINIINEFRQFLLRVHRKSYPPNIVLYEIFQHFWLMPCLRVAAELNVAAIVENDPKSPIQLADVTKSDPENLFRIIRALSTHGIFTFDDLGRIMNTDISRTLIDGKDSMRPMILQHLGKLNWTVFNELGYTVKTGLNAFKKVNGKNIYDYLPENPAESILFDRSISNLTQISLEPLLNAYDFSKYKTIVDIGGGEGLLLSAILQRNPNLQGILYDLPEGLKNSTNVIQQYGVSDRMKVEPGNFFESVPQGADAYLLKNVLHNWSDDDCIKILTHIRDTIPADGKLLVVEMVIEKDLKPSLGKLIDVQMMVYTKGGRERTRKQFRRIIGKSGFNILRYVPTIAPLSIIEAQKFPIRNLK